MSDDTERLIIITGNPVGGYRYFGPYKSYADAEKVAEKLEHTDWWIARLEPKREARHA